MTYLPDHNKHDLLTNLGHYGVHSPIYTTCELMSVVVILPTETHRNMYMLYTETTVCT